MSRLETPATKKLPPYREAQFYWMTFAAEVSKLMTYQDAVDFVQKKPQLNNAYGRYHRNLSILVYTCSAPAEMSWEERELFRELVRRWKEHNSEMFVPEILARLEQALMPVRAEDNNQADSCPFGPSGTE